MRPNYTVTVYRQGDCYHAKHETWKAAKADFLGKSALGQPEYGRTVVLRRYSERRPHGRAVYSVAVRPHGLYRNEKEEMRCVSRPA